MSLFVWEVYENDQQLFKASYGNVSFIIKLVHNLANINNIKILYQQILLVKV